MAWQFAELLLLEKKKSWNSYYVETNLECTNNKLIFHEVFWEYKMAQRGDDNMARNQKNEVLIVGLSSLSLLVLPALYYSGANSLIVGTYTIIMFIVLSTLTISMINSKKGSKEQDLQNAFELTEALTENQSPTNGLVL